MPYLDHFALARFPFQLTPDRTLYYPVALQPLREQLRFALARGDGLCVVAGEVGTGKTLLCRLLLEEAGASHAVAFLNRPAAGPEALLAALADDLPAVGGRARRDMVPAARLQAALLALGRRGRRALFVVDEAQTLGPAGLETLRQLGNYETDRDRLVQIVLFGQPELGQMLVRPALRQMAQRVTLALATRPLTQAEGAAYVRHRLRLCAVPGHAAAVFAPRALVRLVRQAGGIPRVINLLADRALIAAFAEGAAEVSPAHVRAAAAEPHPWLRPARSWRFWTRPEDLAEAAAL